MKRLRNFASYQPRPDIEDHRRLSGGVEPTGLASGMMRSNNWTCANCREAEAGFTVLE